MDLTKGCLNWLKKSSVNKKFTIMKKYTFSASHHLNLLPDGHPCANVHGHNYDVFVYVRKEVDNKFMWLVDFKEIDKEVKPIIAKLDHRHLNPILDVPTCEMIALFILEGLPEYVFKIRVSETNKTWGEVER